MADQTEVERQFEAWFANHGYKFGLPKFEMLPVFFAGNEAGYEAGYEAGARAKWISVSEKLPEDGQVVLAWFVDDNRTIGGELREDAQVWEYSEGHPCFPRKAGKRQGVTHWQAFESVRSLPLTEGK